MSPFPAGLLLGLSLIVAIGAQNVFVLRQGLRREHVGLVAVLCAASDAVLIVIGISGIGAATQVLPWLVEAVRWAGAVFLVGYGLLAARRAIRPAAAGLVAAGPDEQPSPPGQAVGRGRHGTAVDAPDRSAVRVALACLALTWLNPHVYLDTVFLLGSVGAAQGEGRWVFALGAATASIVWFFSLAYGARLLGRWLATATAWRVLDGIIAVVMVALGVSLVL